jgi:hypothetical protein
MVRFKLIYIPNMLTSTWEISQINMFVLWSCKEENSKFWHNHLPLLTFSGEISIHNLQAKQKAYLVSISRGGRHNALHT